MHQEGSDIVSLILARGKRGLVIEPSVNVTVTVTRRQAIGSFLYFFFNDQYDLSVFVSTTHSDGRRTTCQEEFCGLNFVEAERLCRWEKTRRLGNGLFCVMDRTVPPGESSKFSHLD